MQKSHPNNYIHLEILTFHTQTNSTNIYIMYIVCELFCPTKVERTLGRIVNKKSMMV